MYKHLRALVFIFCTMAILYSDQAIAQIDDVGTWFSATVQKKITRQLEGSLMEEIRFNHDVTTVDVLITDAGIEYAFTKKLKAAFHYRFINKNQPNYYSKRHRLFFDLSYKEKVSQFAFTVRARIQEQYTDVNSSETGKIPDWVFRGKLTAKYDLDKKYSPYISAEMYYQVDNAKQIDNFISRFRYEAGFSYDFNRVHSLNPYILYQVDRPTGFSELVYGLSYTFSM
jgi:hypothetical protein